MSETVRYIGEIKEIEMPEGNSWIENVEKLQADGNVIDYIDVDDLNFDSGDIAYLNDKFYKIIRKEDKEDYEDIFDARKDEVSGIITFTVKYYNGGCGFDEALEQALKDNGL